MIRTGLLLVFVSLVAACAAPAPAVEGPTNLQHAQQTLIDFFSLLSNGQYAQAVELHANDTWFYDSLRRLNIDVDPENKISLLQKACDLQLQCLEINRIVSSEIISDTEFMFVVEFKDIKSSFDIGPIYSLYSYPTEFPIILQFKYGVEKAGARFFVHGIPPPISAIAIFPQ